MQKITPFLWFDTQAEEAVGFYLSVFQEGKIQTTKRYPEDGPRPAGTVMTIEHVGLSRLSWKSPVCGTRMLKAFDGLPNSTA